ncbi:class I SAM-dependent methyltransferase [Streptomyces sp. NPDC002133]|uniref:class I SAM-dependent methyltransferase n=1 Tax=Streptomyces sp. NPDC002133 TaxID=3154409 RepID=UPI00332EB212
MAQTSAPAQSPAESRGELPQPTRLDDVKGWFRPVDQVLFDWFLTLQRDRGEAGDLLELGAYMGKSAIFLGMYLRDGEEFTVCDLWDSPAPDVSNSAEMNRSYATLTRRAFEANYLSFHDQLPTLVQAPTSVISSRVRGASCRFVHIDASHLYEHVKNDIEAARELVTTDGLVVLDDFRAEHCPGVAAAAWGAVATSGLRPVCITATKMYGTWGAPEKTHDALLAWLRTRTDLVHVVEEVAGAPLIRIDGKKSASPAQPESRHRPGPATGAAQRRRAPLARRVARDLLPPILTRALRRVVHGRR